MHITFIVLILLKDFCLNLVPVVFAADGSTQITFLSLLVAVFGIYVLIQSPHVDTACWFNEWWMALSVATLFLFAGSMGFTVSDNVDDITEQLDGGKESTTYETRSAALLAVQLISVGGSVCVFLITAISAVSEKAKMPMPCILKHQTTEELNVRKLRFVAELPISQGFADIMPNLDFTEWCSIENVLTSSMAILSQTSGTSSETVFDLRSAALVRRYRGKGVNQRSGRPARKAEKASRSARKAKKASPDLEKDAIISEQWQQLSAITEYVLHLCHTPLRPPARSPPHLFSRG